MMKHGKITSPISIFPLVWASYLLISLTATGCFENGATSKGSGTSSTTTSTNTTSLTNAGYLLYIANIPSFALGTGSNANAYQAQIFFSPVPTSQAAINSVCGTSSLACVCNFSWVENNTTNGSTIPVNRSVQMPVVAVGPSSVTCNVPPAYATGEILVGTVIQINVAAGSGNGTVFTVSPYNYTRMATSSGGSFQDAEGNSFENIDRYSCFEQSASGQLASQMATATNNADGSTLQYPMSTEFCVQKASGSSSSSSQSAACAGQLTGSSVYSSQSYYHNLYIQDSERGDINYSNQRYFCPQVSNALGSTNLVGTQSLVWPLDKTFALSLGITTTFTVGVEAFSTVSDGTSDPVSLGSTCPTSPTASPSPGAPTSSSSLTANCLGFAAPVNSDGVTCPTFKDSTGVLRSTYRLRRYIALYPPLFDADGTPMTLPQPADTIYVLDRPVSTTTGTATMRGPKPCPFAFFDKAGVTTAMNTDSGYPSLNGKRPGYVATNNTAWTGTNVNGIQFPNSDSLNSCAATVALPGNGNTVVSLATVSAGNPAFQEIYVRPITAFAPKYVEDTSFLACAPQAILNGVATFVDPPLHFAKDPVTGNVGWCAETYPTQNASLTGLDVLGTNNEYPGDVANFTSHAEKNAPAHAACVPTPIPSIPAVPTYPAASVGTCSTQTLIKHGQDYVSSGINDGNQSTGTVYGLAHHPNNYVIDPNGATSTSGCSASTCICSNQSCDRTVSIAPVMPNYPLLAPAQDVENTIVNDISDYGCIISYDSTGAKTGKYSPSKGCCSSAAVQVVTGAGTPTTAHLEPGTSTNPNLCGTPTY